MILIRNVIFHGDVEIDCGGMPIRIECCEFHDANIKLLNTKCCCIHNCVIYNTRFYPYKEIIMNTTEYDLARHRMWCYILGETYSLGTRNQKKRVKEDFCNYVGFKAHEILCDEVETEMLKECADEWRKEKETKTMECSTSCITTTLPNFSEGYYSYFSSFSGTTPMMLGVNQETNNNKDNTMYNAPKAYANAIVTEAYSSEKAARDHLLTRLTNVQYQMDRDLEKDFGVRTTGPKDVKDMIEWIKSDKFEVKVDDAAFQYTTEDGYSPRDFMRYVTFRDKPMDKDGYAAAKKLLEKAYTDTQDAIMVSEPAEGLKALKDFESKTFH